jgi:organic radical activating enzyme
MQQAALAPLTAELNQKGFYCEVETNGTIAPSPDLVDAVSQWNVSPKLANSDLSRDRRIVSSALTAFRDLPNAYFKFVMANLDDGDEVCSIVENFDLAKNRVILMPKGVTRQIVLENSEWVADLSMRHGFRFSTRLHVLLWGDERGR